MSKIEQTIINQTINHSHTKNHWKPQKMLAKVKVMVSILQLIYIISKNQTH